MAVNTFVKYDGAGPRVQNMFTSVAGASAEANGVWYYNGTTADVIYQRHELIQYSEDVFYIVANGSYADGPSATGVNGGGGYSTNAHAPTSNYSLKFVNGDCDQYIVKGEMRSFDDTSPYNGGTDGTILFNFFNQVSLAFDPTGKTGPSGTGVGNLYTNIAEWKLDNANTEWVIEYRKKDGTNKLTFIDKLNATETVSGVRECQPPDNSPHFGDSTYWVRTSSPYWRLTDLEEGDEWWVYFITNTAPLPEWPITGIL
tara:strand:- start:2310 stop:3080 length:771 start_codon:yes stop_codon:yes gene_type:complete